MSRGVGRVEVEVTGYGLWVLAKGSCSERARWTTDEDGWHTTTQHDTTQHSTAFIGLDRD